MVTGLPLTERNLILTGYIEPNQPRVGRQVAAQLRMPFVDVGEEMRQRYGDDIETLRERFGERQLKTMEDEVMAQLTLYRHSVIRVTGSVLAHGDYYERLSRTGPVICLVARLDAILQRLHLRMGARYHNPGERAREIGRLQREWVIRKQAGLIEIDATYMDEATLIQTICDRWQELAIERI